MNILDDDTPAMAAPKTKENESDGASPAAEQEQHGLTKTLYPKIHKLSDFVHSIRRVSSDPVPLIGSVKLHGTHADIVFDSATSHSFRLQSRNQLDLKAGTLDNSGFAEWVGSLGDDNRVLLRLRDKFLERYRELNPGVVVDGELIIAAEWCGTGIQKKVAICKVPKFLALISVFINGAWVPDWEYVDIKDAENMIFNIGRAGYFRYELRVDGEGLKESEAEIKRLTDEVERECPFAKQVCGETGVGEGIVWKAVNHCGHPRYWFKSKGDRFAVSNVSKLPVSAVDIQNRERVMNFAKAIVTENRMEQGWGLLEQKNEKSIGMFLKWVTQDCLAEEELEMKQLEIPKGKIQPAIVSIAKPWFLEQLAKNRV